jgi:hypothetical protein
VGEQKDDAELRSLVLESPYPLVILPDRGEFQRMIEEGVREFTVAEHGKLFVNVAERGIPRHAYLLGQIAGESCLMCTTRFDPGQPDSPTSAPYCVFQMPDAVRYDAAAVGFLSILLLRGPAAGGLGLHRSSLGIVSAFRAAFATAARRGSAEDAVPWGRRDRANQGRETETVIAVCWWDCCQL